MKMDEFGVIFGRGEQRMWGEGEGGRGQGRGKVSFMVHCINCPGR